MGTLAELTKNGLEQQLQAALSLHAKVNAARDQLLATIDACGLTSAKTMQLVGSLQRANRITVGLYNKLVELDKSSRRLVAVRPVDREVKLEHSALTIATTAPIVEQTTSVGGSVMETVSVSVPVQSAISTETIAVSALKLPEAEEARIKARVARESEKMRARMAIREAKMRERVKAGLEKRANRSGMQLKDAVGIKERKDKIVVLQAARKAAALEIGTLWAEIQKIRPKRRAAPAAATPTT